MTVDVSGSATPEEVAAVLAALACVRATVQRPQRQTPYERWRSVRLKAVSPAARQP